MKIKILALLTIFSVGSGTVSGAASNCGDGNQLYYTTDSSKKTVFYAASKNEFDVIRTENDRVVITDMVNCRYGKDTLKGIETVSFLDGDLTIEDLIIHNTTRVLALDVLREFIRSSLQKEYDGSPQFQETAEQTVSSLVSAAPINVAPNSSITNFGNFGQPRRPVGDLSDGYQFSPSATINNTFTNTQNSTSFTVNTTPSVAPDTAQFTNGTVVNSSNITSLQSSNNIVVPVSWDASSVGYYDIIYFEATFNNATERQYLGSSTGFRGFAEVQLPSNLLAYSDLEISVRSGTRVLGVIPIETQAN